MAVVGFTVGDLAKTSAGGADASLIVFEADGIKRWRRPFGTTGHDRASHAALHADFSVFVSSVILGALFGLQAGGSRLSSRLSERDRSLPMAASTNRVGRHIDAPPR